MGINTTSERPEELVEALEALREELDEAADLARVGGYMPLPGLDSYEALAGEAAEVMDLLTQHFEFNPSAAPVREYEAEGEAGTPGEGKIKVSVYATNDPEIFIGKREYADGDTVWEIRPLELAEGDE